MDQSVGSSQNDHSSVSANPAQAVSDPGPASPQSRGHTADGANSRSNRGTKRKALGRKDLGRKAWARQSTDRRSRTDGESAPKRRKTEDGDSSVPIYATQFSQEDIDADERRPKRKAAVLMGYSGTGYHGMQLSSDMKTIEGELFPAFVAAGAISKANAMDPKKSSLVRCARTDKGVHAAGNVVSMKLILEDSDVVQKVNENLSPQIRVWGIESTTKGFNCYKLCDSRMYEYLIPSHCFLPPHPSTFLACKLREIAQEQGALEEYERRQEEVRGYWEDIDDKYIKPILERLPEERRKEVQDALCIKDEANKQSLSSEEKRPTAELPRQESENTSKKPENVCKENADPLTRDTQPGTDATTANQDNTESTTSKTDHTAPDTLSVSAAIDEIRSAYFRAKEQYRIHPDRLARVNEALSCYNGVHNFHNYTIKKPFKDQSAKRLIKSFKISRDPIIINGTEWLSLKVHGQSFMMHQIRKMVAMVAMIVRCGTSPELIAESYGPKKIPIPKAPGLGLLLERPIFDNYNSKATSKFNRNPIDFSRYEKDIEEFKEREIYQRIFREEAEVNAFGNFFNHIDTFPENSFLYVTAGGIPAATQVAADQKKPNDSTVLAEVESESESELIDGGEEGG